MDRTVDTCTSNEETCNGKDDDCDGSIDEDTGGQKTTCGVGACESTGEKKCQNGQLVDTCEPGSPGKETCNGKDDDCDGSTDEGLTKTCGQSTGQCQKGTRTCTNGTWGSCQDNVKPSKETCNGRDNDCDGVVNEGCECTIGESQSCGQSTGQCEQGTQTCAGGTWGPCQGRTTGSKETCNGKDDDCDGSVDEGLGGQTTTCGTGACEVTGKKVCRNGGWVDTCTPGSFSKEVCDGKDNDCDGQVDEKLTKSCGQSTGQCQKGTRTCTGGTWGTCQGEVTSSKEVCNNKDDDCDGQVDEGVTRSCGTSTGLCQEGTQTCTKGTWSACQGKKGPKVESHHNQIDRDCDGLKKDAYRKARSDSGRVCALTLKGGVKCWKLSLYSNDTWLRSGGLARSFVGSSTPFPQSHTYTDVAMGEDYVCALRTSGEDVDCIVEENPTKGYAVKEFTESGLTDPLQSIEGGARSYWCGIRKSGKVTCGGRLPVSHSVQRLSLSGDYRDVSLMSDNLRGYGVCGVSKKYHDTGCKRCTSNGCAAFSGPTKRSETVIAMARAASFSVSESEVQSMCGLLKSGHQSGQGRPKCWGYSQGSSFDSISPRTWTTIQWADHALWGLTPSGNLDCVDCNGSGYHNYQYPSKEKFKQVDIDASDRGCGVTKKDTLRCWGHKNLSIP